MDDGCRWTTCALAHAWHRRQGSGPSPLVARGSCPDIFKGQSLKTRRIMKAETISRRRAVALFALGCLVVPPNAATAADSPKTEANLVAEITFEATLPHPKPLLFEDTFDKADAASWKDYGTPTRRVNSRLVGGKGMVTVAEKIREADLMASAPMPRRSSRSETRRLARAGCGCSRLGSGRSSVASRFPQPHSIRRRGLSEQNHRASSGPPNIMQPTCLRPRIGFWCSNDSTHENAHI